MADPVNVKPVLPDQSRQETPQQGRPKPRPKPKPPVDPALAPVDESARRAEMAIVQPNLGGKIHAIV